MDAAAPQRQGACSATCAVRLDALAGPGTTLVTFNGASFDLPLLRQRLRRYGVIATHLAATHIDLLLPARRLWRELEPDCRLGTLERSRLGVSRQGDVAGGEIRRRTGAGSRIPPSPRRSALLIERVHVHNVVGL
ncbi:MAG: ribonuclease H-like domain-containing protein [Nannocystaceae bacterium]